MRIVISPHILSICGLLQVILGSFSASPLWLRSLFPRAHAKSFNTHPSAFQVLEFVFSFLFFQSLWVSSFFERGLGKKQTCVQTTVFFQNLIISRTTLCHLLNFSLGQPPNGVVFLKIIPESFCDIQVATRSASPPPLFYLCHLHWTYTVDVLLLFLKGIPSWDFNSTSSCFIVLHSVILRCFLLLCNAYWESTIYFKNWVIQDRFSVSCWSKNSG